MLFYIQGGQKKPPNKAQSETLKEGNEHGDLDRPFEDSGDSSERAG